MLRANRVVLIHTFMYAPEAAATSVSAEYGRRTQLTQGRARPEVCNMKNIARQCRKQHIKYFLHVLPVLLALLSLQSFHIAVVANICGGISTLVLAVTG